MWAGTILSRTIPRWYARGPVCVLLPKAAGCRNHTNNGAPENERLISTRKRTSPLGLGRQPEGKSSPTPHCPPGCNGENCTLVVRRCNEKLLPACAKQMHTYSRTIFIINFRRYFKLNLPPADSKRRG